MLCQELEQLKTDGCIEELHIVQWFQPGHDQCWDTYRRLDTYMESSLQQAAIPFGIMQVTWASTFLTMHVGVGQARLHVATVAATFTGIQSWVHQLQDQKFRAAVDGLKQKGKLRAKSSELFTEDHALIASYLISLQFFRTFRWRRSGDAGKLCRSAVLCVHLH